MLHFTVDGYQTFLVFEHVTNCIAIRNIRHLSGSISVTGTISVRLDSYMMNCRLVYMRPEQNRPEQTPVWEQFRISIRVKHEVTFQCLFHYKCDIHVSVHRSMTQQKYQQVAAL
jgi:hypothetical protein